MEYISNYNDIYVKEINGINVYFDVHFEYEFFNRFCSWMKQIFVLKNNPFNKLSSDFIIILNDFNAYELNITNENIYEKLKLFNKQIKFSFYYYENILTVTYHDHIVPGKINQVVINKPFNYDLSKNSFIIDPYSKDIKFYDNISERFVKKEELNNKISTIGKYNIRYNNLNDNEIMLLDYIITICKYHINHPEKIKCTIICDYIIKNHYGYIYYKYEDDRIYIKGDDIELKIRCSESTFYVEYNRIKNEYINGCLIKNMSTFYIDYITKSTIFETYYKHVELLRYYISDHKIGINHSEKKIIDEIYDLEKIRNIQYNN